MSEGKRSVGVFLIVAVSVFLLWSIVGFGKPLFHQDVNAIDLRQVCRCLSDIRNDVRDIERQCKDRESKRALNHLGTHIRELEDAVQKGTH